MDTSKDTVDSARSQRLQDRNLNKELQKTDSICEETVTDKYAFVGMPTESSATKSVTSRTVPDSFAPPVFSGANADADTWLAHFQRYAEYRQLSDEDIIAIFPLFLRETAMNWYETLGRDAKSNLETLVDNFKTYFGKSPFDYVFEEESVFTRAQRPREKARDYIAQMQKLAKRIPALDDGVLLWNNERFTPTY